MKRIIIALSLLIAVCFMNALPLKANSVINDISGNVDGWKKVKDNKWPGVINGESYWYKMDGSGKLWWSADGKSWEADADGMWADKESNFYKIDGGKVVWSPDAGNTWSDAPEWKWQAIDGNWYKLDKNRAVWVKKEPGMVK